MFGLVVEVVGLGNVQNLDHFWGYCLDYFGGQFCYRGDLSRFERIAE